MSGYRQGRDVEWAVVADLKQHGWAVTRAASSKGLADVIGIRRGLVALINVKRTQLPPPDEREALYGLTVGYPHLIPVVARRVLRGELEYRELRGVGPQDWRPWFPEDKPLPKLVMR